MTKDRAVELEGGIRSTAEEDSADKKERRIKGESDCEIRNDRSKSN